MVFARLRLGRLHRRSVWEEEIRAGFGPPPTLGFDCVLVGRAPFNDIRSSPTKTSSCGDVPDALWTTNIDLVTAEGIVPWHLTPLRVAESAGRDRHAETRAARLAWRGTPAARTLPLPP